MTTHQEKLDDAKIRAIINMSAASYKFKEGVLSFYETRGFITEKQTAALVNAKHRTYKSGSYKSRSYYNNLDHDQICCQDLGVEGACYWGD
jgi:hypothetical protein